MASLCDLANVQCKIGHGNPIPYYHFKLNLRMIPEKNCGKLTNKLSYKMKASVLEKPSVKIIMKIYVMLFYEYHTDRDKHPNFYLLCHGNGIPEYFMVIFHRVKIPANFYSLECSLLY